MWTDRIGQKRGVVGGGTANQSESRHHDVTQTGRNMSLVTEGKWRKTDSEGRREKHAITAGPKSKPGTEH